MLDLSRIETGRLEMQTEKINLKELILETVDDIRLVNSNRDIQQPIHLIVSFKGIKAG